MSISKLPRDRIKTKALLIDLDNTLIFGDKKEVFERLLATINSLSLVIDKNKLQYICENNSSIRDMIVEIIKDKNISLERFIKEKEKFEGQFDHLLFLDEGVVDCLEYFKQIKIPMAIVSTRTSKSIPRILKNKGILEYFDVIVGRDDCNDKKPSSEPLELALSRLNITSKEDVYMIGDKQEEDIKGAINTKLGSILVNKNLNPQESLPDFHVERFGDLRFLIR